jgi:hypothetical protein
LFCSSDIYRGYLVAINSKSRQNKRFVIVVKVS